MTPPRAPGAAGIAGLLCVGLLASGLTDAAPAPWRAVAALAGVLVLPSLFFVPLARRALGTTAAVAPFSFLLALSALAVWTQIFTVAGASFSLYAGATTWTLMALYAASAVRAMRRRGRAPGGGRIPRGGAALVAVCALAAAVLPPTLTANEDSPDHVGYVRRIASFDTMRPDGVLAAPVDDRSVPLADPRKGAFHPVLALAGNLAAADPVTVWRALPVVLFPVAVLSFLAFNAVFVAGSGALAACVLLFLLSYGGNVMHFAPASGYGQNLAANWGWMLLPAGVAVARGLSAARAAPLALLIVGGVLVHLGVVVHAAVAAATLALFGPWMGLDRARALRAGLLIAALTAGALGLRAGSLGGEANAIHSHPQGLLFMPGGWFVASPMEILRQHGMVFLGGLVLLPLVFLLAPRHRDARAIAAAAVIPLLMAFTPLAVPAFERGSYLTFRALLNVPVFAAVVVAVAWLVRGARAHGVIARAGGAVALVLWALAFVRPALGAFAADMRTHARGVGRDEGVSAELVARVASLPPGRVILSDPATSYLLSAWTTHRFVSLHQQHANPYDAHALDRLRAIRDALSPFAMPEAAVEACRRYGVDYVVVNGAAAEGDSDFLSLWDARSYPAALGRLGAMPASFMRVDSTGGAVLFRVDTQARVGRAYSGAPAPVTVEWPPLAGCEVPSPDGAFRITGVSVVPSRVLPGDTVTVVVGYSHEQPSAFGLPQLLHVRFDHESISARPRYPGEKYVRRVRERWSGEYPRFRADFRPGHGVFEPDLWPIGAPLRERFRVVVPRHATLGAYRVEVAVVRDSLLPNFALADLLFNRDHYSGTPCAALQVSDRVSEPAP